MMASQTDWRRRTQCFKDPDGVALPNLYAMGARTGQKDIIVELNAMKARPGTTYGSLGCSLAIPRSITRLMDRVTITCRRQKSLRP